jgi:hypothetical protein
MTKSMRQLPGLEVHEQVLVLEVTMDYAVTMTSNDGGHNLLKELDASSSSRAPSSVIKSKRSLAFAGRPST